MGQLAYAISRYVCIFALIVAGFALVAPAFAGLPSETVLHSFGDGSVANDGTQAVSGLVQAGDGTFYGTTGGGGAGTAGTVFAITPSGSVTILHSFRDGTVPGDGSGPEASLILGIDGNLYGTTIGGGAANAGTAFTITPLGAETILHSFEDTSVKNDGGEPVARLLQTGDGSLYGVTTEGGGNSNSGSAFQIDSSGKVEILHSFGSKSTVNDGKDPQGGLLLLASDGNFYGTTQSGGSAKGGTIFEMTPAGAVTILHSFGDGSVPQDGLHPISSLCEGADGSLYGMTIDGGSHNLGTAFKVTTSGSVTILHSFHDGSVPSDGENPLGNLIQAPDGNFYGTTWVGGAGANGTVFQMTPSGTEKILHSFDDGSVASDGQRPYRELVQGADGSFYGTTYAGGSAAGGTVFRVDVAPAPHTLSLMPTAVTGGSTSTATFSLDWPVPRGGLDVKIHSANTTIATVPSSSIHIAYGESAGMFSISTSSVTTKTTVAITVRCGGVTKARLLTVKP